MSRSRSTPRTRAARFTTGVRSLPARAWSARTARRGGGVYGAGALTVSAGSVISNTATGGDSLNISVSPGGAGEGGGIFNVGSLRQMGGTIAGNAAGGGASLIGGSGSGGGIANAGG